MKRRHQEYLFNKFEPLYRGHKLSPSENLMSFGFECGDGWFNLIRVLSWHLCADWLRAKEVYSDVKDRLGEKQLYAKGIVTQEIIDAARIRMETAYASTPMAFQVKEKFGGLRFYVDNCTKEQNAMIQLAESMSYRTCDVCGAPGKTNRSGWIKVRCPKHR